MEISIDRIKVKKRIRRDPGNLKPLMDSMEKYGLMNAVVINEKNELIAGERRYESAKKLGWHTIPVKVIKGTTKAERLEMEIDENTQRLNLTSDEIADAYIRLDKMKNPGLFRRIWNFIINLIKRILKIL